MDLMDLFVRIGVDDTEMRRGLDAAASKVGDIAKGMTKAFAAATAAAAAGMAAFATSSVKVGETFDRSMSQVAATMGKTVDEIQELRDFAQQMGSETAFSATQAADALNYMALAGYDAETSMEMLPNVLNLAAAGGMELATASDMITDAQSALGLSLDDTTELVDKMAVTASKANTSVAQMGDAILTVGGTAKNLAGGTTELSQALGILADNGIKGAEGGTALRNIILALSAPTDTAAKKLKELGVEAYDAAGNMRALPDIFDDLNAAMSDMTQGEQTDVLNTIFNKVDLKSANALLATSTERWDELATAIDDANGAAEKMAETQLDNLAGDITLFQSAVEGAQIAISDGLTPTLREFVKFGTESVSELTKAFNEDGLTGAVDAFGDIIDDGIAMITDKIPIVLDAGIRLVGAIGDGILDNLPAITNAALQTILTFANGLTDKLPYIIPKVVEISQQMAETLISHTDEIVEAGAKLLSVLIDSLLDQLPKIIEGSLKLVGMIAGELLSAIQKADKELNKNGESILEHVLKGLVNAIKEVKWSDITDAISDAWLENGGIDPNVENIGLKEVGKAILNHVVDGIMNYTIIGLAAKGVVSAFEKETNKAMGGGGAGGHREPAETETEEEPVEEQQQTFDDRIEEINEFGKTLQRQAAAWKKTSNDAATTFENALETIDHEYALHQIDEETYLKKKLNIIKTYEDKESEEWWKYYDDTIARINKIEDGKRKAQEQQDQKTKQAQQQKEQELRNTIKHQFEAFEKQMIKEGKDDKWLVEMERAYIEKLDHASDIYWEYDLQISRQEKKINDSMQAERDKQWDEQKKNFENKINDMIKSAKSKISEYQKALENIKEKVKKFGESLTKAYTDAFSFDKDEKTGKITAKKTKNFITDATKQLETYYANIKKLRGRNISDAMLDQLQGLGAEEGNALAEYWLSLTDEQLKNQSANWARYEKAGQDIAGALYKDEVQKAEQELDQTRNTLLGEIKAAIDEGTGGVASALGTAFDAIGNMGIVVNVAGENVITSTINKYLKNTKNTGAVLDV